MAPTLGPNLRAPVSNKSTLNVRQHRSCDAFGVRGRTLPTVWPPAWITCYFGRHQNPCLCVLCGVWVLCVGGVGCVMSGVRVVLAGVGGRGLGETRVGPPPFRPHRSVPPFVRAPPSGPLSWFCASRGRPTRRLETPETPLPPKPEKVRCPPLRLPSSPLSMGFHRIDHRGHQKSPTSVRSPVNGDQCGEVICVQGRTVSRYGLRGTRVEEASDPGPPRRTRNLLSWKGRTGKGTVAFSAFFETCLAIAFPPIVPTRGRT